MKTLEIKDGDLVLSENGRFAELTDLDCLKQRLNNRMKMFLGEWFIQPSEGVDWIGKTEKPFNKQLLKIELIKRLDADSEVDEVVDIEMNPDVKTRSVDIEYTVTVNSVTLTDSITVE